jgi:proton-coupled amino acid transporter
MCRTVRTIFNIFKTYVGVGVLGLPAAWKDSGIVGSLGAMLCLSVISLHCLQLLVDSKEDLIARGHKVYTFGDTAIKALGRFGITGGKVGGAVVDIILCFCQLGVCTTYLAFLGQNTKAIIPTSLPWHVFAGIWIGIMMLFSWIRTLKSLAFLAQAATFCLGVGIIIISVAAIMSLHDTLAAHQRPQVIAIDWINLPSTISVAIFAFEGIGFVIPAQTAIKDVKRYPFVLTFCIVVVGLLYAAFGTICYVGFGNNTQPQILDSLLSWSNGSKGWTIVSKIITVGLIAAIAFTYPIQLFVATDLMEERLFPPKDSTWAVWWLRNNFRAMLVFATGIVALTVSQFDIIMGFIGSLGAAPLQFILPPIIWLCVHWEDASIPKRALLFFYIIFGIAATVLGTGVNIYKLVKEGKKD